MKKRILSILLCCVMLVGLLPTVALAEGGSVAVVMSVEDVHPPSSINSRRADRVNRIFFTMIHLLAGYCAHCWRRAIMKNLQFAALFSRKNTV